MSKRGGVILLATVILLAAAFHFSTIRPGHDWGGDFALYIAHAKALAEGRPYADTGFLYNRAHPWMSPPTYPPVLPLILAPVIKCCGLNLEAMKAVIVALFVTALPVMYLALRGRGHPWAALAAVAAIAFNPYFWQFKDSVLSDLPFLLFVYLAFYLHESQASVGPKRAAYLRALALGVTIYLAFGTRTLGALLVPSVVLAELIRSRRWPLQLTATLIAFAVPAAIQSALLHSDAGYLDQLAFSTPMLLFHALEYAAGFAVLWDLGQPTLTTILAAVTGLLAIVGFIVTLHRRGPGAVELFVIFYLAVIILWSSYPDPRFLIPIMPLYVYYAFTALALARPPSRRAATVTAGLVAVIVLATYAARYATLDWGPLRQGIADPETQAVFQHIRDHTPPEAVIIFHNPRVLALFTDRKSARFHAGTDDELLAYFRTIGARYVLVSNVALNETHDLDAFCARQREHLQPIYRNDDFLLLTIR